MRALSNERVARTCFARFAVSSHMRWAAIALVTMVAQSLPLRSQAQSTTAPAQASQNSKSVLQQAAPAPSSLPSGSLKPAASDPPFIKYQNGELTIEAHNSTLSDVLRAVAEQTGAEIDFPPDANQPVAGRVGPGPVVEVLDRLLRPLSFDYGIQGSAAHPNEPVRVLLVSRPARPAAPRQGQGPPSEAASPGVETAMISSEPVAEDPRAPSREALEQHLRTIQESLIGRRNAPGRQGSPDSQQPDQPPQ